MKIIKSIIKWAIYCILSILPLIALGLFIRHFGGKDVMSYWCVAGLILWNITHFVAITCITTIKEKNEVIQKLMEEKERIKKEEQAFFDSVSSYMTQFNDYIEIQKPIKVDFSHIAFWLYLIHKYLKQRKNIIEEFKVVDANSISHLASMMSDIQALDIQAFLDAGRTFCYGPVRIGYYKIPKTSISTIQECKDKVSELAKRERILTYTIDLICSKYKFIDLQSIQSEIPAEVYRRTNTVKSLVQLQIEIDSLGQREKSLNSEIYEQKQQASQLRKELIDLRVERIKRNVDLGIIESRIKEKKEMYESLSMPIPDVIENIATLYADVVDIEHRLTEHYLRNKTQPAIKAADAIKEMRKEKMAALYRLKVMQYEYDWLLQQLPDYADSVDDVIEELETVTAEESGTEFWLTKEEWSKLSDVEKNQLALDRYNKGAKKSNRRIGYDYELYCGYYIQQGELLKGRGVKKVWQYGIENGKEDKGRDIIVESDGKIYIAQCKCWKQERPIRENTIMQLYGSAAEYCIAQYGKVEKNPLNRLHSTIVPVLITTTNLSPEAQRFAEYLGVEVCQFKFDKPYPQIKCNIGKDGTKIYHLPFDQQYDTTIIERDKGEFLAFTVEEAENKGFRHAMKHSPIQD